MTAVFLGIRPHRAMGIQQALEWAFGRECARLEHATANPDQEPRAGVSAEWLIAERHRVGCSIDYTGSTGWGGSAPAADAEVIAAFVAALAPCYGGWAMAKRVAELARAGITPDWMPDARPRVVPIDTRTNQNGVFASTEDAKALGAEGWPNQPRRNRKGVIVHDPVLFCPVRVTPTRHQIAHAREGYLCWWEALSAIGIDLSRSGMLDQIEITSAMPPISPWRK